MSETLWLRVEGHGEPDDVDHSLMFQLSEPLDALAARLGVTALSTFYDWSDYEWHQSDGKADESSIAAHARWHDTPALLLSLRAISDALAGQAAIIDVDDSTAAALTEELEDCISKVRKAADQHRRVHLCVVM